MGDLHKIRGLSYAGATDDETLRLWARGVGSSGSRDRVLSDAIREYGLLPVVPAYLCVGCLAPFRRDPGLCAACVTRRRALGKPLASLEAITIGSTSSALHSALRRWKDAGGFSSRAVSSNTPFRPTTGGRFAALLSAYLHAHREDLFANGAVAAMVPSSTPVVRRALSVAQREGWWTPQVIDDGQRDRAGSQRRSSASQRTELRPDHWVAPDEANGQSIVLIDDVLTTGYSLHSYAEALRRAGATAVRGVVVERVTSGTVYQEAEEWFKRSHRLSWHPAQRVLADTP